MYVLAEIIDYFWEKVPSSHFNNNDLLNTLNACKTPRKEHQVVNFGVTDEIAASEILFWKYLEYVTLI